LADPTQIAIRRYVKVKSDANPFDPHWRSYFENRKKLR
jgi:RNA-directed DNA polymerase